MKPFKAPYVKLMQAEVTRLVDEFVVPVDVKDFSELHDYIDVNELGGFCDESSSAPLIEMYGDEAFSDFVTECQSEVDAWIRAGGCGKDSYFDGYLSDFAKLIRSEKKWQHLAAELLSHLRYHQCDIGSSALDMIDKADKIFSERTL